MSLASLLSAEQIIPEMKATERWSAIVELIDLLVGLGKIKTEDRESILASLKQREETMRTGIGFVLSSLARSALSSKARAASASVARDCACARPEARLAARKRQPSSRITGSPPPCKRGLINSRCAIGLACRITLPVAALGHIGYKPRAGAVTGVAGGE